MENEGKRGRGKPDERPDPGWPGATMFKLQHVHSLSPELMAVLARCQSGPADTSLLESIFQKLAEIKEQGDRMAEDLQELQTHIIVIRDNSTQMGEVVDVIAERLRLAAEQAASKKLTPEEFVQLGGELRDLAGFTTTVATQLKAMATGPVATEPVPPAVEDVPPVEA